MFGEKFKKKYALTDKGLSNTKKGAFWTVIVNLIMMAGMGILFFMIYRAKPRTYEEARLLIGEYIHFYNYCSTNLIVNDLCAG